MNEQVSHVRIRPLRNIVLIRPEPSTQASGPLMVIAAPRAMQRGRILACGPDVRDLELDMMVIVNTLAGTQLDGYLLVPETAVVGIVSV